MGKSVELFIVDVHNMKVCMIRYWDTTAYVLYMHYLFPKYDNYNCLDIWKLINFLKFSFALEVESHSRKKLITNTIQSKYKKNIYT